MQDRPEGAAADHEAALNGYLLSPGPTGKKRDVDSLSTTQMVINQEIITTTTLCCDDDEEEGE